MNDLNKNSLENLSSAFEQYEAPFSADEMQADWQQVSAKIGSGAPASSGSGGSFLSSAGFKIVAAIISVAALVGIASLVSTPNNATTEIESPKAEVVLIEESEKSQIVKQEPREIAMVEAESKTNEKKDLPTEKPVKVEKPKTELRAGSTGGIKPIETVDKEENSDMSTDKPAKTKAAARVSTFEMCQGNRLKIKLSNADNHKIYFYRMINQENGKVETGSLDESKSITVDVSGTYHLLVREMGDNSERVLLDENVVVFEKPTAKMAFSKDECGNYTFTDKSRKASNALWLLPNKALTGKEVNYAFEKEGYEKVSLIVSNGNCSDTLTRDVLAERSTSNVVNFSIPNIFTPNADGNNDAFDIAKRNPSVNDLVGVIEVYDLRNNLVFKSINGLTDKWNGKQMNVGRDCDAGNYTYVIKYQNACNSEKQEVVSGLISIVR